jgi:hypothetical protein
MPKYKSHKTVNALEIKTSEVKGFDLEITYADKGYENIIFKVPPEMKFRYVPVAGDYHVFYENGYASFSPRKAFIEGYSLI